MTHLWFGIMLVAGCGSAPRETSPTGPAVRTGAVSGAARIHDAWCAGVAPRPEDQARMQAGAPITTPLFVHAGKIYTGGAPIATIVPRADGTFPIDLPPGEYCVITSEHPALDAPIDPLADASCVHNLRQTCEANWIIGAKGATNGDATKVDVYRSCGYNQPCYPPGPPPP